MRRIVIGTLPWVLALGFFLAWRDARSWMLAYQTMNANSQEAVASLASQRDVCQSQLQDQAQRAAIAAQYLQQMRPGDQQMDRERRDQETSDRLDSLQRRLDCEQRNRQFFDERTIAALCR